MSKPSDCIPVTEAQTYQSNWNSANQPSSPTGGDQQVCAVTFSIDQLQEYLDYVVQESANQGIPKPGIRVYFAAYQAGTPAEVGASTTVFFCPSVTEDQASANNYNIDPLNKGQNGWPPNAY